jgi:ADP-ribose pyrophosphatase YjhB (NUDIX family)
MRCSSLNDLEGAVRAAWCLWTSDPVDQSAWSESNPAVGQCGSTALVLQDLLGGELLVAGVRTAAGRRQGVHYFNRLAGGIELDLTREQFRAGETVGAPRAVSRPQDVTRGRLAGHYRLLAARVARELAGGADAERSRPVLVKGVCADNQGRVLLCRGDGCLWELPGGRPEVGELFQDTLARELEARAGLALTVDRVLGVTSLEPRPGAWVDVVGYECLLPAASPSPLVADQWCGWLKLSASGPHAAAAWFHAGDCMSIVDGNSSHTPS